MCKQLYGQLMILSTAGIMPITAGIIIPIFSIPFFFFHIYVVIRFSSSFDPKYFLI